MNDTIDKETLETRLAAASRTIRFAAIGVLPSYGRTVAALEAVLEARQADPAVCPQSEVAEVTLRNMTRLVLPSQKFCKVAAREIETVAQLIVAARQGDAPAVDRPRG